MLTYNFIQKQIIKFYGNFIEEMWEKCNFCITILVILTAIPT